MLAGDMQQGWAVSILSELSRQNGIDPALVLYLIKDSEMRVQSTLIEGQVLDIQYSKFPIDSLSQDQILDMLWKKISSFASKCGIAFQLQDDILGIVGDEKILGKPVGSDIREGKRTAILYHAFKNANSKQKAQLMKIFGNPQAEDHDIEQVKKLLRDLGSIEYTKELARSYVKDSLAYLYKIPQSEYKDLLSMWAEYMIEREF